MNATKTTPNQDAATWHRCGQILAALHFALRFPSDVKPNEIACVAEGGWIEQRENAAVERQDGWALTHEGHAFLREFLAAY